MSCFVDLNSDCPTTAPSGFWYIQRHFQISKKLEEIAFLSWQRYGQFTWARLFGLSVTCFAVAVTCSWNTFHWVATAVDMVVTLEAVSSGRLYFLSGVRTDLSAKRHTRLPLTGPKLLLTPSYRFFFSKENNLSLIFQGHPTTIFGKISVRKTIWDLEFSEQFVVKFLACLPLLGLSNI